MNNVRDYGLGSCGEPIGKPVATKIEDDDAARQCPRCGCEQAMEIKLRVRHPNIRGGEGTCVYIGCPACPWASPAVVTSDLAGRGENDE